MISLLRRAFLTIILSICVAAPIVGLSRNDNGAPSDDAETPLYVQKPLPQNPLLPFSFLAKECGETACLKCIMSGTAPRDTKSADTLYADSPTAKADSGTVERFLGKVLTDQRQILLVKKTALHRWNRGDQALFATWFGTTSPAARSAIQQRVDTVLNLNKQYRASNFRAASPSKPGVFAYVYPRDPTRMFLDREFFKAGATERAGTLAHEMSHFLGTQDHAYGPAPCKSLARRSSALALQNADNFEFYLEGRR